jgi:spore germination protein YaaH
VRPSPTPLVYTVKPGDSLLSIAKRFKTTGRSIAYWNRATYPSLDPDSSKYDPDRIEVGWKLVLTPGVTIDQALESPPAGSPTPEPTTY